jgi:hypothetical protein
MDLAIAATANVHHVPPPTPSDEFSGVAGS